MKMNHPKISVIPVFSFWLNQKNPEIQAGLSTTALKSKKSISTQ